jgi:hypothetical protein
VGGGDVLPQIGYLVSCYFQLRLQSHNLIAAHFKTKQKGEEKKIFVYKIQLERIYVSSENSNSREPLNFLAVKAFSIPQHSQ